MSVDWGTHNQLITFAQTKNKYSEIIFKINGSKIQGGVLTDLQKEYIVDILLDPAN